MLCGRWWWCAGRPCWQQPARHGLLADTDCGADAAAVGRSYQTGTAVVIVAMDEKNLLMPLCHCQLYQDASGTAAAICAACAKRRVHGCAGGFRAATWCCAGRRCARSNGHARISRHPYTHSHPVRHSAPQCATLSGSATSHASLRPTHPAPASAPSVQHEQCLIAPRAVSRQLR